MGKRKNRCREGGFLKVPKIVLRNPNYIKLSAWATKLIFDLGEQYRGDNNGDLCATWMFMRKRGWKSKDTLNNALHELKHYELIVQTQYGGLNCPSLYALPWFRIDRAKKETGVLAGERPMGWKREKTQYSKINTIRRRARKKRQERLQITSGTVSGSADETVEIVQET